ncbi:chorismate mutase [Roseibium sp. RKSG952]|uniref:chorismate mutase n=1 Tax=Roseibium sp. RKSG952 TaxID=2529384 RepID=UPI0012BCFA70|nr:chorismate mutase [Roseibium sp. RKSG952]MTH95472.1 chorismate mutase [Roseibium sp. RKSG952]
MSQDIHLPTSQEMLKERLDTLDARIHELLIERAQVVEGVVSAHRAAGEVTSVFDPVACADGLRLAVERHSGSLPVTAVEHLLRDILGTAAYLEEPFTVYLDGSLDLADLIDVARYHFGFHPELDAGSDAADVVGIVAASGRDIGLIALSDRAELPWWRGLSDSGAQVVARLPFLAEDDRPAGTPALVIARSGKQTEQMDVTVYDARWGSLLPGDLMGQGIEVLSFHRSASGVDALIAISSDLDEMAILAACKAAGAEPDVLRFVGGFAAPIDVNGDPDDDFDLAGETALEG